MKVLFKIFDFVAIVFKHFFHFGTPILFLFWMLDLCSFWWVLLPFGLCALMYAIALVAASKALRN